MVKVLNNMHYFGLYLWLVLVSPDVDPVLLVLDLDMKYTVEVVHLFTYIVWFYHMIAAPDVRSVGCVFAHLYTLVDHSEYPCNVSCLCYLKVCILFTSVFVLIRAFEYIEYIQVCAAVWRKWNRSPLSWINLSTSLP